MVITPDQFTILERAVQERLVRRLKTHFSQVWPQLSKSLGGRYDEFIERAVQKALSYGLDTEQSIARFVNVWFVWGADFEARPLHRWAYEILTDSTRSAALKAHQLAWRTEQELRRALARSFTPEAVEGAMQRLREEDLFKKPGVAETLDWAAALTELDQVALDPETVSDTLGVLLKYQDDIARIEGSRARQLLDAARAERAAAE
jgi:hypothetical protein